MPNQQLIDYISQSLQLGVPRETIRTTLVSSGWTQEAVQEAFATFPEPAPAAAPTVGIVPPLMTSMNEPPLSGTMSAPPIVASSPMRIGVGSRLGALFIDGLAVGIGGMLLGGVLGSLLGASLTGSASFFGVLGSFLGFLSGAVAGVLILGIFNFVLELSSGASVGKLVLGLRIGSADATPAALPQLALRSCMKNIGLLFFLLATLTNLALLGQIGGVLNFVVILGGFLMLGNSRQALHDLVSRTAVFHRKDLPATGARKFLISAVAALLVSLLCLGLFVVHALLFNGKTVPPSSSGTATQTQTTQATSGVLPGTATVQPANPDSIPNDILTITSMTPSSGPAGINVTVHGRGFDTSTAPGHSNSYEIWIGNDTTSWFFLGVPPLNENSISFVVPLTMFTCSLADQMNHNGCDDTKTQHIAPGTYQVIVGHGAFGKSNTLSFTVTAS